MGNTQKKIKFKKKRLKNALKINETSLKELAPKVGIPLSTLRHISADEMIMPDYLDYIAQCLNIDPAYLLGNNDITLEEFYSWVLKGYLKEGVPEQRAKILAEYEANQQKHDEDGVLMGHYISRIDVDIWSKSRKELENLFDRYLELTSKTGLQINMSMFTFPYRSLSTKLKRSIQQQFNLILYDQLKEYLIDRSEDFDFTLFDTKDGE